MKTKNIFSVLFAAVMSLVAFTSCDYNNDPFRGDDYNRGYTNQGFSQDRNESMTLSGQWTGNYGMFYTYTQYGYSTTYDSYKSDVIFNPDYSGATRGWGREVDWYNHGPYSVIQHKFYWEVRNGIVYLSYPSDSRLNCSIRDYCMTDYKFTGYFSNGYSRFTMSKISDYYDWSCYTSDVSSIASTTLVTRAMSDANATEGSDAPEGTIVCGNHYADNAQ